MKIVNNTTINYQNNKENKINEENINGILASICLSINKGIFYCSTTEQMDKEYSKSKCDLLTRIWMNWAFTANVANLIVCETQK
jgi:hypothetical protein